MPNRRILGAEDERRIHLDVRCVRVGRRRLSYCGCLRRRGFRLRDGEHGGWSRRGCRRRLRAQHRFGRSRRRTSAVVRWSRLRLVQAPAAEEHDLVRLDLVGRIAHHFIEHDGGAIGRARLHAGISVGAAAQREVEPAGAGEQDAEIGRHDAVGGTAELVVGLDRARPHAEHELASAGGGAHHDARLRTHAHFPAAGERKSRCRAPGGDVRAAHHLRAARCQLHRAAHRGVRGEHLAHGLLRSSHR